MNVAVSIGSEEIVIFSFVLFVLNRDVSGSARVNETRGIGGCGEMR